MKKLAVLIACHKKPNQINALTQSLVHPDVDVFLHIDKKANIREEIVDRKNLYIIPETLSVDVEWAKISQVDATLTLIKFAAKTNTYRYYIYISGEDYPCKPINEIVRLSDLQENRMQFWESLNISGVFNHYDKRNTLYFPNWIIGRSLMQKILKRAYIQFTGGYNKSLIKRKNTLNCLFYFGSSWWGLTNETVEWMLTYLKENTNFYRFYSHCMNPDESFFHTLFMLSPYGTLNTDYLTYLKFLPKRQGSKYTKNSPEYLDEKEIRNAKNSKYYFMRKIDMNNIKTR